MARTTLEKHFRSIALIQTTGDAPVQWLLRKESNQDHWRFIVGERLNRESFRETVTREVGWQLNLNPRSDFLVSNMALLSMEYVDQHPEEGTEQHVAVSFYPVHIYRERVRQELNADETNRWVSAAEICEGKTVDNQPIHPQVVQWINKWEIVRPWQ